jgi:DNA polymerase (family 10)
MIVFNQHVADRLDEVADVLAEQGANPFRIRAYRRGANVVRRLPRPVGEILAGGGPEALEALPGIGPGLARSIHELVRSGRLPMLERLRGETDPVALLMTVPGIGRRTADRLHHDLEVETLEELEMAAHDGRLTDLLGFGPKRLAGVRAALAQRLSRVSPGRAAAGEPPPVSELLDVDAEYRAKAAGGSLETIAPRRLNPRKERWLPVLHTERAGRHYTALFSNTPRAHRLRATRDWVVLYLDGPADGQWTVVTARQGPLQGRRIVRGREEECRRHYGRAEAPPERRAG